MKNIKPIGYNELIYYITYRQIKYSSSDLIQIKNILDTQDLIPAPKLLTANWLIVLGAAWQRPGLPGQDYGGAAIGLHLLIIPPCRQ